VLANFAVEQDGQNVRVIDFDGSVYSGQIISVSGGANAGANANASLFSETRAAALKDQPEATVLSRTVDEANEAGRRLSVVRAAPAPPGSPATKTNLEKAVALTVTGAVAAPPSLDFSVIGTNTTFRQSVLFTGTLVMEFVLTNSVTEPPGTLLQQDKKATEAKEARGGQLQDAYRLGQGQIQDAGMVWRVSTNARVLRVQGRGRYGGTNEVAVDAVPAGP
jgi:hypothetical protein